MIVLIDNYDSFSYNLVQMIGSIEPDIQVVRNDQVTADDIENMKPSHLILSPGPGYPRDAGILEEAVMKLKGKMPILGVCLGHQGICEAFGGTIAHAKKLLLKAAKLLPLPALTLHHQRDQHHSQHDQNQRQSA